MTAPASRTRPDVAVIIPTRGGRPALLERALRSVIGNGYAGNVTPVVVADGVEDYGDVASGVQGVRIIPNDRTPGLAGARNTGLLAGDSEFVAFCDDDDEWVPGKLQEQIDLLLQQPQAMLATCGISIVQQTSSTDRWTPDVVRYGDLLKDRVMTVHSSTLVMRRAPLLQQVGLLDELLPGSFGEDYDLLLRVARHGPLLSVPRPLVRVHWHGASHYFSEWLTIEAALRYLLAKHSDFRSSRRGRARLEAQIAFALAASHQRRKALAQAALAFVHWPLERRVALAVLVALGVGSAESYQSMAHRFGHGL